MRAGAPLNALGLPDLFPNPSGTRFGERSEEQEPDCGAEHRERDPGENEEVRFFGFKELLIRRVGLIADGNRPRIRTLASTFVASGKEAACFALVIFGATPDCEANRFYHDVSQISTLSGLVKRRNAS